MSKRDWVFRILITSVVLAVPLYPKFPFLSIPGTYVSIRLEDVLILFVAFYWIIFYFPRAIRLLNVRITQKVILFVLIGLVSLISGVLVTKTVVPHIGFLHLLRRIQYFIPLFLGMTAVRSKKDLAFYIKLVFVIIAYAFAYGMLQKYFKLPVITTQNYEYSKGVALTYNPGGHLNSTFAGHYDLATFLVFSLPLVAGLLFSGRVARLLDWKISERLSRLTLLVVFAMGIWLLVHTVSRISMVSYLGAVSFTLLVLRKYKAMILVGIVSVLVIGLSTNLIARYTRVVEVAFERVIGQLQVEQIYASNLPSRRDPNATATPTPVPVFEDRSTSIRFNVEWPRAVRAFKKNPLLGTGYSSITLATDNDYLRLLGELGILGVFGFGLILYEVLKGLVAKLFKYGDSKLEDVYLAGIFGGILGVFLNGVFIDVFEASKFAILFWMMTGFAISSMKKYKIDAKN